MISSYNVTTWAIVQVTRIKKTIFLRNSPDKYKKKHVENSEENMAAHSPVSNYDSCPVDAHAV